MKIISFITIILLSFCLHNFDTFAQSEGRYTIVIHGGAGYISPEIPQEVKKA
jgi:hypothetical protein